MNKSFNMNKTLEELNRFIIWQLLNSVSYKNIQKKNRRKIKKILLLIGLIIRLIPLSTLNKQFAIFCALTQNYDGCLPNGKVPAFVIYDISILVKDKHCHTDCFIKILDCRKL